MSRQYGSWSRGPSTRGPRPSGPSGSEYPEPTLTWDNEGTAGCRARSRGPRPPSQGPPENYVARDKRLLGLLKEAGGPHFEYFELEYLKWVRQTLTEEWHIVHSGYNVEATNKWVEIFLGLELDQIAQMDLVLLSQQSASGRALANEVLWEALTTVALHRTYEDISNWVTRKCHQFRKRLDRPPKSHRDRGTWSWDNYSSEEHSPFSPSEVPPDAHRWMNTGPGGAPLRPPECWQRPAHGPAGP